LYDRYASRYIKSFSENFSDNNLFPQILTRCLNNKFIFENGGRKYLLSKCGLSIEDIAGDLKRFK
tara:strand:+ start:380 stop:574 length:195 start_codon:yes stop_codon:yes gene_type:complete